MAFRIQQLGAYRASPQLGPCELAKPYFQGGGFSFISFPCPSFSNGSRVVVVILIQGVTAKDRDRRHNRPNKHPISIFGPWTELSKYGARLEDKKFKADWGRWPLGPSRPLRAQQNHNITSFSFIACLLFHHSKYISRVICKIVFSVNGTKRGENMGELFHPTIYPFFHRTITAARYLCAQAQH